MVGLNTIEKNQFCYTYDLFGSNPYCFGMNPEETFGVETYWGSNCIGEPYHLAFWQNWTCHTFSDYACDGSLDLDISFEGETYVYPAYFSAEDFVFVLYAPNGDVYSWGEELMGVNYLGDVSLNYYNCIGIECDISGGFLDAFNVQPQEGDWTLAVRNNSGRWWGQVSAQMGGLHKIGHPGWSTPEVALPPGVQGLVTVSYEEGTPMPPDAPFQVFDDTLFSWRDWQPGNSSLTARDMQTYEIADLNLVWQPVGIPAINGFADQAFSWGWLNSVSGRAQYCHQLLISGPESNGLSVAHPEWSGDYLREPLYGDRALWFWSPTLLPRYAD